MPTRDQLISNSFYEGRVEGYCISAPSTIIEEQTTVDLIAPPGFTLKRLLVRSADNVFVAAPWKLRLLRWFSWIRYPWGYFDERELRISMYYPVIEYRQALFDRAQRKALQYCGLQGISIGNAELLATDGAPIPVTSFSQFGVGSNLEGPTTTEESKIKLVFSGQGHICCVVMGTRMVSRERNE